MKLQIVTPPTKEVPALERVPLIELRIEGEAREEEEEADEDLTGEKIRLKPSSNEVYCTSALLSLINSMLCSKHNRQSVWIETLFL